MVSIRYFVNLKWIIIFFGETRDSITSLWVLQSHLIMKSEFLENFWIKHECKFILTLSRPRKINNKIIVKISFYLYFYFILFWPSYNFYTTLHYVTHFYHTGLETLYYVIHIYHTRLEMPLYTMIYDTMLKLCTNTSTLVNVVDICWRHHFHSFICQSTFVNEANQST